MRLFCTCISLQLLAHNQVPHKEEDNLQFNTSFTFTFVFNLQCYVIFGIKISTTAGVSDEQLYMNFMMYEILNKVLHVKR